MLLIKKKIVNCKNNKRPTMDYGQDFMVLESPLVDLCVLFFVFMTTWDCIMRTHVLLIVSVWLMKVGFTYCFTYCFCVVRDFL